MARKSQTALKELAAAEPDINLLREEFLWFVQERDQSLFRRDKMNWEARFCKWSGQSWDGKRWTARQGDDEVFPWPGASDARPHLIDKYVNEDKAFLMAVWRRMRIQVAGVESNDAAFASRMSAYLRWMKFTQMSEANREARLLAEFFLSRGKAVLGVFWEKQQQLGYAEIDMEAIRNMAQQAQQQLDQGADQPELSQIAQAPTAIMDPSMEDQAVAMGAALLPDLKRDRLRRVIRDLRSTGHARFPQKFLVKNRPSYVALAPNEDVFLPPEAIDLENARGLDRRELVTESQLRERIESHDWDEAWVDEVIESQRGKMVIEQSVSAQAASLRRGGQRGAGLSSSKLFEVVHAYRRRTDEDGVPGIYYTCYHPGLPDTWAYHSLLNYEHGEYPFTLFQREVLSRLVDDSRGYGEVGFTWQQQIKTQWDSRIDRASIATLPPSFHPTGMAPEKWGPGVKVPVGRPDMYGFFETPKYDLGSKEAEETVRRFADEYFGRVVDPENPGLGQLVKQELADVWMEGWKRADTQLLQLAQQFESDDIYFRVVGSQKGKAIHASRDEIQGRFDLSVAFNAADLDPQLLASKIELLKEAAAFDQNGVMDHTEVLNVLFELADPNLGERLLRPAESASQAEVDDERTVFAKISSGLDEDVKPGQAFALRLQTLQQIMQDPVKLQRYQQDEEFRTLVDNRMKRLQHQVQQFGQNAQIGRQGA